MYAISHLRISCSYVVQEVRESVVVKAMAGDDGLETQRNQTRFSRKRGLGGIGKSVYNFFFEGSRFNSRFFRAGSYSLSGIVPLIGNTFPRLIKRSNITWERDCSCAFKLRVIFAAN